MSTAPHATCISSGVLRRGLSLSVTASSLGMVFFAIILNMPFQMLLEALGASGFLGKPYSEERLLELIRTYAGAGVHT